MKRLWLKYASKSLVQIVGIALILAAGVASNMVLASLREPPRAGEAEKQAALTVEVTQVHPQDAPVVLKGNGVARSLNVVDIIPEVPGRLVEIHPRLEVGEIIPAGDVLFKIDPRDYEAAFAQAEAQVAMIESSLEQMRLQYETDKNRLNTVKRTRDLAKIEFDRLATLLTEDRVGTQSGVDQAERAYNQARDTYDLLEQQVRLYPIRLKELDSNLASAKAQRDRAAANLERCTVKAPFDARITMADAEKDQYVQPGAPLLTLADDSLIEIIVPVKSQDVRQWLQFDESHQPSRGAWFPPVEAVSCKVRWTEAGGGDAYWVGTLHRVEQYMPENVMTNLAVRVPGEVAAQAKGGLPLVDGMFCSVEIPGKMMRDVFALPPWTVSYEGEVYVSKDGKLERREVTEVRKQDGSTFISEGLDPGDYVVTTRLVNPLPNTPLIHEGNGKEEDPS